MAQGLGISVKQQLNILAKKIAESVKLTFNAAFMREVGDEVARIIFIRTRLGYGVQAQGSMRQKLMPLSAGYIAMRKKSKKSTSLSTATSPTKSNLTFTGQLLESIQTKKAQDGISWVGPIGYRNDGLTNEQVANTVSKTRPFMFLSDLELLKINRFAQNNFSSVFKTRFR